MNEKVLPRPFLLVSTTTGNVGLKDGNFFIYVKVVSDVPDNSGKIRYYPIPGSRRPLNECKGLVEYKGPLDDEIIKNLLIYGC